MIELGFIESFINFLIWSSGVSFSLYSIFLIGEEFNHAGHDVYQYEDFSRGWFNRYQDTSDFEWNCWTRLTIQLLPWLLVHFFGAECIRSFSKNKNTLSYWYCLVSLSAIASILSPAATLFLLAVVCSFHFSLRTRCSAVVWLNGFLCRRYVPTAVLANTEEESYIIEVASSWLILRCVAYCMEVSGSNHASFKVLLGYSFYLPTFFCGPLVSLSAFIRGLVVPSKKWTLSRLKNVAKDFIRCAFWYFFTLVALHFIYVNAILIRPHVIARMSAWQMSGLGIAMGHFFHLKYVVFYGLPCCWAAAEGFSTPRPPCCVSRIYLYSEMWRYFDYGLYSFLVRYIYIPILKFLKDWWRLAKRTVASTICFIFVYFWHGEGEYVLYWAILNFSAVTVEGVAREVYSVTSVRRLMEKNLNPANRRRLHCVLAAPLHYFSMLSNYFFIGSLDVGKIYFIRASIEPFQNNMIILFFLYGAAQTAVTIKIRESKRAKSVL